MTAEMDQTSVTISNSHSMTVQINLRLVVLLFTGTVVNLASADRPVPVNTLWPSSNQQQIHQPYASYLRDDDGGFVSDYGNVPCLNKPPMGCQKEQRNMAYHPSNMNHMMVLQQQQHQRKRSDVRQTPSLQSSCNCRKQVEVSKNGHINLGDGHFPEYLPRNVSCDQSMCSDFTICQPTEFDVHVLRRNNACQEQDHGILLPPELSNCWHMKKYTVLTDCLCVNVNVQEDYS